MHWLHIQQATTAVSLLLLEAQFDWSLVLHTDWLMLGGVDLNLDHSFILQPSLRHQQGLCTPQAEEDEKM